MKAEVAWATTPKGKRMPLGHRGPARSAGGMKPLLSPKLRWRALDRNGIAHAFTGTLGPALCGAKNQPEIHDWNATRRCPTCVEKAAVLL